MGSKPRVAACDEDVDATAAAAAASEGVSLQDIALTPRPRGAKAGQA